MRLIQSPAPKRTDNGPVPPEDSGATLLQVIIFIVISAILLGAVAPPLLGWITRAEESVMENNLVTTAQAVELIMLIDKPDSAADLKTELERDGSALDVIAVDPANDNFSANAPDSTATPPEGLYSKGRSTVYIQKLGYEGSPTISGAPARLTGHGGTTVATTAAAPKAPWMRTEGSAFRLAIVDANDVWVCALVVSTTQAYVTNDADTTVTARLDHKAPEAAAIKGIWYDSGEGVGTTANTQFDEDACSPVATAGTNPVAPIATTGEQNWVISTSDGRTLTRTLG